MKYSLMLGAVSGFSIGALLGLAASGSWPSVILKASGGALGLALLFRWWRGMWVRCLTEALRERAAAAAKETPQATEGRKGATT